MPAVIRNVATAVPIRAYRQDEIGEVMQKQLDPDGKAARLLRRIYRHSGIETRHSVVGDYRIGDGDGHFFDGETGCFLSPSTRVRNEIYTREARSLFAEAARNILSRNDEFAAGDVTHVVTVSCTGFFAPGPDYFIVKDLGLNRSVQRFHLGFMGCFGAFPALKMARAFCEADPTAVVLIVCLELCTLHLEPSENVDDLIAGSVFADGAGGAIVSAVESTGTEPGLRLGPLHSTIAPDSEDDMAWTIGDRGFDIVLSTYVPRILEANVEGIVENLLSAAGLSQSDVRHWAVHPGGRAILDKVEAGLGLNGDALESSRSVLSAYGNMSSATIWFVLDEMLRHGDPQKGDTMCAMAFGPGLTVESAILDVV